jgi:6-phosphogluconate dehydrogenase (decarboxylating)
VGLLPASAAGDPVIGRRHHLAQLLLKNGLQQPDGIETDLGTAIDVGEVAELWRRGSVVGSWLVDLIADAFARSPKLDDFAGRVSDSGEGRWTVLAAIDEGVPATVIATSLFERFDSRLLGEYTDKILSAMRSEFGGHAAPATW